MARILYLHRDPSWAGFIADDAEILRSAHEVDDVLFDYQLRSIATLAPKVLRTDLVYFWWGDITGAYGALLAKAMGKPSVMITGGYDIASVPEIGYGLRHKRGRRHLPPVALNLATHVVANAEIMRRVVIDDYGVNPAKVSAIPHGVGTAEFPEAPEARTRMALTCAQLNASTIDRKGIGTFVEAARQLPDCRFVVAGKIAEDPVVRRLVDGAPSNVEFTGFVERATLLALMREAAAVVQVSAHEGFGVALAEAMLAGATPVVTDRGALPEVVGDVGAYVPYADPTATAQAIQAVVEAPKPAAARARIETMFPIGKRKDAVLALVDRLLC